MTADSPETRARPSSTPQVGVARWCVEIHKRMPWKTTTSTLQSSLERAPCELEYDMSGSHTQNKQECVEKHSHLLLEPSAGTSHSYPGFVASPFAVELSVPTIQQEGALSPSGIQSIMSLLTPSEALAFQSFLTSLDAADFSAEWNMQLDIPHGHVPPSQGKEALTKATRDLMSLDADKWRHPLRQSPGGSSGAAVHRYPQPHSVLFSAHPNNAPGVLYNEPNSSPSRLQPGASSNRPPLPPFESSHARSTRDHRSSPPACHSPTGPSGSSSSTQSSTPGPSSAKRSPPLDAGVDGKRHRPSNAPVPQSPDEAKSSQHNRAALLSPSQKKANHIQSEQKRRANIRRGYDALCEMVPALREACQAEEERTLVNGKTRGRRRGKGRVACEDGEKTDGRAGPRSENVVLSKSTPYLIFFVRPRWLMCDTSHRLRE